MSIVINDAEIIGARIVIDPERELFVGCRLVDCEILLKPDVAIKSPIFSACHIIGGNAHALPREAFAGDNIIEKK